MNFCVTCSVSRAGSLVVRSSVELFAANSSASNDFLHVGDLSGALSKESNS